MADVQTNLLSYIITKLHSDVARIESLIHQVHTGQYEYAVVSRHPPPRPLAARPLTKVSAFVYS